jgi:hypothetical protein
LVSEVWVKLVRTVTRPNDEELALPASNPADWSEDPKRDTRVVWLIRKIGGAIAIRHRHADTLRQRGPATVPVAENEDPIEIEPYSASEDDTNLRAADARRVWLGLLAVAGDEFGPEEDVTKLLRVLASSLIDITEEFSGTRWPVTKLVALLNEHFPPPDWKDRRVEDAKRRLNKWINRLMRTNAFDATALEALFARVARQQEC